MTSARGRRKVRTGRVVSDKMDKTVVVAVERRVHHRLYGKSLRRVAKFKAHDETNQYQVGDLVSIVETRPLSLTKRWRVLELLSQREVPEVAPAEALEAEVEEMIAPTPAPVAEPEEVEEEAATAEGPAAEVEVAEEEPAAKVKVAKKAAAVKAEEPAAEAEVAEEEPAGEAEEPAAEVEVAEEEPVAEAEGAEEAAESDKDQEEGAR